MADELAPGTQVRMVNGRLGVVVSVHDRTVEVVFPGDAESLDIDDLVRAADEPLELLQRDVQLGDGRAYACASRASTCNTRTSSTCARACQTLGSSRICT